MHVDVITFKIYFQSASLVNLEIADREKKVQQVLGSTSIWISWDWKEFFWYYKKHFS